jgi:hypothetical protein
MKNEKRFLLILASVTIVLDLVVIRFSHNDPTVLKIALLVTPVVLCFPFFRKMKK